MRLKTDSFVVESNVHFPTDYNLLWDCLRKCLDTTQWFLEKYQSIAGWRKIDDWRSSLKGLMREFGKISASGGKHKEERMKKSAEKFLEKTRLFLIKLQNDLSQFPYSDTKDLVHHLSLEDFMQLAEKHIDLIERRVLRGRSHTS